MDSGLNNPVSKISVVLTPIYYKEISLMTWITFGLPNQQAANQLTFCGNTNGINMEVTILKLFSNSIPNNLMD
jgi:hypothetical protein